MRAFVIVLGVSLVAAGAARADEPAAGGGGGGGEQAGYDDVTAQARAHFDAGMAALSARDGATALRELEAAQALRPAPVLDCYLANAFELLGRPCEAIEHYRHYQAALPTAPNHAEIEGRIAELEPSCRAVAALPPPGAGYEAPPAGVQTAASTTTPTGYAPTYVMQPTAYQVQPAPAPRTPWVAPVKRRAAWKIAVGVIVGVTLGAALIAGIAFAAIVASDSGSHHSSGGSHIDWDLTSGGRSTPPASAVPTVAFFRF
jgi:hypothetical protein